MNSSHPKQERTFVIIKPDGVQRSLIGEVIKRIERTGLKLVALKLAMADEKRLWQHYNKDDAWFLKHGAKMLEDRKAVGKPVDKTALEYGKSIIDLLVAFMTSGPVVMMAFEGNQAVAVVKKLVGGTEPATSDVGTIRGDFTLDSYSIASFDGRAVRNLIHCSDKPEEAEREIALWLSASDLISYRHIAEEILYDVNLDGKAE